MLLLQKLLPTAFISLTSPLLLIITIAQASAEPPLLTFDKRDFNLSYTNQKTLNTKFQQNTATIYACTCTVTQYSAYTTAANGLELALRNTGDDCRRESGSVYTASQSTQLVTYTNNTLLPTITDWVTAYIKQYQTFARQGLNTYAKQQIAREKKIFQDEAFCYRQRISSAQQQAWQTFADKSVVQFNRLQAVYGTAAVG